MSEFRELRNEYSDNPAGFDQMKAEALDLLRSTDAYLIFVKKDDGLHCMSAIEPGVNAKSFIFGTMRGMKAILERMGDMIEEIQELEEGEDGEEN